MIEAIVATLVVVLGVPVRFKYAWQANMIRRNKSARNISRKFYITSWIIYCLQVAHNLYQRDYVDVVFWTVGVFTVAYCIYMSKVYWHEPMPFWRWVIDSFQGDEEGGIFK